MFKLNIMEGFIKYMRSEEAVNLHSNKNANHLLSIIAFRASRKGNPVLGVKPGEAFIGDYKKMELSHQEYRSAVANLVKWGYITTTTTNKGTIARLCNSDVYDINSDLFNKQTTSQQQTSNKQTTTINNERKKEKKKEYKKDIFCFNREQVKNLLDKFFGPSDNPEVHLENIIQWYNVWSAGTLLTEEFVAKHRGGFLAINFEKYKYNTEEHVRSNFANHLRKSFDYSDKKKSTSLRKQTDYKAYLINFFTHEHPDASEKKAKGVIAYHESTGVLEQRIKKFAEIREDLISYHKKYFTKYPKLLLFDIFDMCYDKRGPFGTMRITDNPTDKKMQQILSWLKRQYKEREYHMNTKSIRANMELFKRKNAL